MLESILYGSQFVGSTKNSQMLDDARKLLVKYIVKIIPSSKLQKEARLLSRRIKEVILTAKRQVIDRTEYFLTKLWRAVHECIRNYMKIEIACAKYDVLKSDILSVMEILDPDDLKRIERSKIRIERLLEEDKTEIHRAMKKHIKVLIGRRRGSPRFIANSDPGYSILDIKKAIWEEGFRLFLYYEHFGNAAKIRNYVKQGMRYFCVNFIYYNNAECRRAMSSIEGDSSREYMITRVSINSANNDDENIGIDERLEDKKNFRPDVTLEQKWLVNVLATKPPYSVRKFVEIIIGNHFSEDFCKWLHVVYSITPNEVANDYLQLGDLAMEYLGVSRRKVIKHIGPYIDHNRLSREQKEKVLQLTAC